MFILGDVFAVVALIATFAASFWAQVALTNLLFHRQVEKSVRCIESKGWRLVGPSLFGAVLLFFSIVMLLGGDPLMRLVGLAVFLVFYGCSAIGSAAVTLKAARKVTAMEPSIGEFAALVRTAMMICLVCLFPVVGWFLVIPLLSVYSFAAGWGSLFGKRADERIGEGQIA
jgi:hypothetical protein